jgi:hypothetical protein
MSSNLTTPSTASSISGRPRRQPNFTLAKHIARASADEIANARAVLGDEYMFRKFFEPELPLEPSA